MRTKLIEDLCIYAKDEGQKLFIYGYKNNKIITGTIIMVNELHSSDVKFLLEEDKIMQFARFVEGMLYRRGYQMYARAMLFALRHDFKNFE